MCIQSARKQFQYAPMPSEVSSQKNHLITGLLVYPNGVQVVVGAAANAFCLGTGVPRHTVDFTIDVTHVRV